MRSRSLRLPCRAWLAGFAWIALALAAGCSGEAVVPPADTPAPPGLRDEAAAPASQHPAGSAALDQMAPARTLPIQPAPNAPPGADRPGLAGPRHWRSNPPPLDRPAFTPHWYTPSVDPLFRRHRYAPGPPPSEPPPQADAERSAVRPPHRSAARHGPASALPPSVPGGEAGVKDFDVLAPLLSGVASWYGPGFHGKLTASGEIYNQHRLTAAHPSLPMGTIIRVENEANGRVVWVRVNDRGPYAKGRVLDLSRAAAERLGMVDKGTAPVRISVLRWPSTTDHELGMRAYTQYVVQVAAYPELDKAETVLRQMQRRFHWADFALDPRPGGALSIIAGPFDEGADAQRTARRLQRAGVTSLVRRYRK